MAAPKELQATAADFDEWKAKADPVDRVPTDVAISGMNSDERKVGEKEHQDDHEQLRRWVGGLLDGSRGNWDHLCS